MLPKMERSVSQSLYDKNAKRLVGPVYGQAPTKRSKYSHARKPTSPEVKLERERKRTMKKLNKLAITAMLAASLTGCAMSVPVGNTGYTATGVVPGLGSPAVTVVTDDTNGQIVHITDGRSLIDQLAFPAATAGAAALLRPDVTTITNSLRGGSANAKAVGSGGNAVAGSSAHSNSDASASAVSKSTSTGGGSNCHGKCN